MTLSSVSSGLLNWSANQTSIGENSVLTLFIIVKVFGETFISWTNCLFGTNLNKTFDECW